MKKSNGDLPAKTFATFQLSLLVLSVFSFSFIISSIDFVSAESASALPTLSKTPFWEVGKHKIGTVLVDGEPIGTLGNDLGIYGTEVLGSDGNAAGIIKNGKFTGTKTGTPQDASTVGQTGVGSATHALLEGVSWAAYAYMAGQMLGSMFGFNEDQTDALSTSLAAGFGVGRALHVYSQGGGTGMFGANGWAGGNAGMIGFAVTVVVFALMYKDTETKVVTFSCLPWQAPNGGDDCEICNDADLPCSEYRCKSLGQSCEIVNEGSVEEKCVYVNPRDVSQTNFSTDLSHSFDSHDKQHF